MRLAYSQSPSLESVDYTIEPAKEIDYGLLHLLQADTVPAGKEDKGIPVNEDIKHAPLVSGDIVDSTENDLLPQIGFLGSRIENAGGNQGTLFLNTNVPFSAFVCGVQGSGKSHTVSCILGKYMLTFFHVQS